MLHWKRIILVLFIALAVIVPLLLYHFVLPRVELRVTTGMYQPLTGPTQLSVKLTNDGSVTLRDIELVVDVHDETSGEDKAHFVHELSALEPGYPNNKQQCTFNFTGSQYHNYTLTLTLKYSYDGEVHTHTFSHTTETYVLQYFEDKVLEW